MKTRLFNIMMVGALCASAIFASCSKENPAVTPEPDPTPTPTPEPEPESRSSYTEQYRPQIHFSPSQNWMNDPNGMVYYDGTYHLFYQYNPYSNDWGNMSWGHATSTDLIHWTEQSVALTKTDLGDIFSGSCVIDKDNTAGFGKNAMIAFYTANGEKQQQAIAYSTDGGTSFTHYSGNPVISNTTMNDFRDPKVFWHEESQQWIMSLAKGYEYAIDFYGSKDLKSWTKLSSFTSSVERCNKGQWECPDLLRMKYNGEEKWVLVVSVNPGGPTSGSGTMYFVGSFDGTNFTADNLEYPLFLDYGMDNYAGVTWSNTGDRIILLGWMNNWNYAGSVPCTPWRSAMTLPRELSLIDYNGTPLLAGKVVSEIDKIAGTWTDVKEGQTFDSADAYHLQVTLSTASNQTVTLQNESKEKFVIELNAAAKRLVARRNANTGAISFSGQFSLPSVQAPLNTTASEMTLDIYIDQSSVEVISSDGAVSLTNLVFPTSIYNSCSTTGTAKVRSLKTIW